MNLPCHVQVAAPRRGRLEIYEERVLQLESQLAVISRTHTRDLISQSLWDKIRLLVSPTNPQTELQASYQWLALWPYATIPITTIPERSAGIILNQELEVGYSPAVPRDAIVQIVKTWTPTVEGTTVPEAFSLWMCVSLSETMRIQLTLASCI